jgi:hypothetical protein
LKQKHGNKENLSIAISLTTYITDDIHSQKRCHRQQGKPRFHLYHFNHFSVQEWNQSFHFTDLPKKILLLVGNGRL